MPTAENQATRDGQEVSLTNEANRKETTAQHIGQRRVNMIWETTQFVIAVSVVMANIAAAFILSAQNDMLGNAFFLVTGFYFGRTNHERQGGPQNEDTR
jgi:hypothetical protein